jgi:hypothetical protein
MSSSPRNTKRKAISYAEVDSDAEDSEQDQEVVHSKEGKRGKGDTYGASEYTYTTLHCYKEADSSLLTQLRSRGGRNARSSRTNLNELKNL